MRRKFIDKCERVQNTIIEALMLLYLCIDMEMCLKKGTLKERNENMNNRNETCLFCFICLNKNCLELGS